MRGGLVKSVVCMRRRLLGCSDLPPIVVPVVKLVPGASGLPTTLTATAMDDSHRGRTMTDARDNKH
jgi:hypothetical protein